MAFHPSINEEAKGFWGGYYKCLFYFLWMCVILINLAIIGSHFWSFSFDVALIATKNWYTHATPSFYLAMALLLFLSGFSYIISRFIDKVSKKRTLL